MQTRKVGWLGTCIIDALEETQKWFTPKEVTNLLESRGTPRAINYERVKHYLRRLSLSNRIQGEGDGIYAALGVKR